MDKRRHPHTVLYTALVAVGLLIASPAFAAANFTIDVQAGTTLPTSLTIGSTVSACYTVVNNTHSARNGYEVRGIPTSVVQNPDGVNCATAN